MTARTFKPRGRPPSPALRDLANLLAAARTGERYRDIAARYGVCASAVSKIAQAHGVVRQRGRPRKPGTAEVRRFWDKGYCAAEARAIMGFPA